MRSNEGDANTEGAADTYGPPGSVAVEIPNHLLGWRDMSLAQIRALPPCALGWIYVAGSTVAWEVMYRAARERVMGFALQLTGNSSDADELFQRAVLHAWEKREHFDPRKPFVNWLIRLTRNLFIDERRGAGAALRRQQRAAAEDAGGLWCGEAPMDGLRGAEVDELRERLNRALVVLEPEDQRWLTLWATGHRTADIARSEGVNTSTARGRLMRAKQRLALAYTAGGA
jgi:RNA polymerase sigma-70 factor, ECF subfamily